MLAWRTFVFVTIALLIISCVSGNTNIPSALSFETIAIDHSSHSDYYKAQEPAIIVLTKPEDLKNIHGLVSTKAETALQKLDFNQELAIAVFQGRKPTGSYAIQIERIVKSQDQMSVHVKIELPTPHQAATQAFTSPYHLVRIKKGGLENQTTVFNLMEGTSILASTQTRLP